MALRAPLKAFEDLLLVYRRLMESFDILGPLPGVNRDGAARTGEELRSLCLSFSRDFHSLKSLAAFCRLESLQKLCHKLEESLAEASSGRPEAMTAALSELKLVLPDLDLLFRDARRNFSESTADERSSDLFPSKTEPGTYYFLESSVFLLSRVEYDQVGKLKRQGKELQALRFWVDPQEEMPWMRLLLVQSSVEDKAILLKAEVFVVSETGVEGPLDSHVPEALAPREVPSAACIFYRCLFAKGPEKSLEIEETDNVSRYFLGPAVLKPASSLFNRSAKTLESEELFGELRRFLPGIKAFSTRNFIDFELSAAYFLEKAAALEGLSAAKYADSLLEPLRREAGEGGKRVRWFLYCETPALPEFFLQNLGEALVHLARNSLVHGYEGAELRMSRKKGPEHQIFLTFYEESEYIVVSFADDGAGMGADLLLDRFGLGHEQLEADGGLLALISEPGFSTREKADLKAGHGLGLHVVSHLVTNVLHGHWTVKNRPGSGLTFAMKFPKNMKKMEVLLVKDGDDYLALPLAFLGPVLAPEDSLKREDKGFFVRFAGVDLPLLNAGNLSEIRFEDGLFLVLCKASQAVSVFYAEHLLGEESLLVETDSDSVYSRRLDRWLPLLDF